MTAGDYSGRKTIRSRQSSGSVTDQMSSNDAMAELTGTDCGTTSARNRIVLISVPSVRRVSRRAAAAREFRIG